jgi:hypothetical protein
MLMIAAMSTAFATPFAGQVFADSVEAGTVEAGLDTSELCNPDNIYVPQPAAPSGRPCPAHVGETDETARARAYLIATATPGYTMTRQGPERAIERLHPEFVKRLAAAIAEARGAGMPMAGIFSAYRPPAFGVGGLPINSTRSTHTAWPWTSLGSAGPALQALCSGTRSQRGTV